MVRKDKSLEKEGLVVTAQQSRFHVDAAEIPTSKEIDIKDINLSTGGRELLAHADLKLRENLHYVIVGRNGTGKSTLLRALAEGRIPGVSWSLRILLLGQSSFVTNTLEDNIERLILEDTTVLQHVLASDARRERALAESQLISKALENGNDPLAVVHAIRKVKHERLLRKLAEIKEIAARRSGARGLKARKELISMEDQVAASETVLSQADHEIDSTAVQSETSDAVATLAEVQTFLEHLDSSSAEARAKAILQGLGFPAEVIDHPYTTLSGGWRTRCSIASALFQKVDVLLLDECTNFLDLPAIIWLQKYIQSLDDTTVVVITHDRDFADAVAEETIVLREQKLNPFKGTPSAYETERHKQYKHMTKMKAAQDIKTKHIESSIASNIQAARRTGDDKRLKQAVSRKKKLTERNGLEVGLKGGRFKLNRDLGGYHLTMRADIEIPTMDPLIRISIPSEPSDLRFPGPLVSMEKVAYRYPKAKAYQLEDIDLVIHPGERVGICGLNGSGKSTLVSLAIGTENGTTTEGFAGLTPTKGTITRHPRAKIRCFSQHAVESLERKGIENPELTALKEIMEVIEGISEGDARALLGKLGLPGRLASDVPIAALSGGQKVRLALAKVVEPPPHLLVLDEVTTHLDADTVLALVESLKVFQGALLVITHDRFFMRTVVEGESPYEPGDDSDEEEEQEEQKDFEAPPGVLYRIIKGHLKKLEGGMAQYEQIAEKAIGKVQVVT